MTAPIHRLRDAALRPASRLTRARSGSGGETVMVVQPDHLGDIVLAQPAVRLIREQFVDRRLVGVVGPWSERIAQVAWPVDDVVTIEFPGFERSSGKKHPLTPYLDLKRAADRLREVHAGTAFVLRPDAWWAAWLASMVTDGPVVTADDQRVFAFSTHQVNVDAQDHASLRSARIALGLIEGDSVMLPTTDSSPLSISPQPEGFIRSRRLLENLGIDARYAVIHPGAGAEVKLWPAGRWRTVASAIEDLGLTVLVTGSEAESELCAEIASERMRTYSVAGQTPLPVLIELLRGAALVLGPDSGPLHLAVACGTPTVHLFGPSDPARYGPWGPPSRHRVIQGNWSCPRCGDLSLSRPAGCGCMLTIETDTVIQTVHKMLEQYVAR